MGMKQTTLLEAIAIMGPKLGFKDVVANREEIVENIDRYRLMLYNMFDKLRLFANYTACLSVKNYILSCNRGNCESYQGITLPLDMDSVMAVYEGTNPLDLRSEWFEDREGRKSQVTGDTEVIPMTDSPTEHCITTPSPLRLYAHRSEDVGKKVYITAVNVSGQTHTYEMTLLEEQHVKTPDDICFIKPNGVILPQDQCGKIDLYQDEGNKLLSSYCRGITVPSYRRYKVIRDCPSGCVYVKGTKKFVPINYDTDVVEIGDRLVLEAAGRYLRYYESSETKELRKAAIDKNLMEETIMGILSRNRGKSQQDGRDLNSVGRRRRKRNSLPGYRRAY